MPKPPFTTLVGQNWKALLHWKDLLQDPTSRVWPPDVWRTDGPTTVIIFPGATGVVTHTMMYWGHFGVNSHRENGPSVIRSDAAEWYTDGRLDRIEYF